jgi:hypothetical protein
MARHSFGIKKQPTNAKKSKAGLLLFTNSRRERFAAALTEVCVFPDVRL